MKNKSCDVSKFGDCVVLEHFSFEIMFFVGDWEGFKRLDTDSKQLSRYGEGLFSAQDS